MTQNETTPLRHIVPFHSAGLRPGKMKLRQRFAVGVSFYLVQLDTSYARARVPYLLYFWDDELVAFAVDVDDLY